VSTIVIDGNWDIIADYLKRRWSSLTPEDLDFSDRDVEALLKRITKRTNADWDTIVGVIKKASIAGDVC
jgi:hypothetical protein